MDELLQIWHIQSEHCTNLLSKIFEEMFDNYLICFALLLQECDVSFFHISFQTKNNANIAEKNFRKQSII